MRSAPFIARSAAFGALALVACNANKPPANEPSSTTRTTGVSVESGPASPGDPGGASTETRGPSVTSAAPAEPMEGNCPPGEASHVAVDLAECISRCRGKDEYVPLGSRCVSARAACEAECRASF